MEMSSLFPSAIVSISSATESRRATLQYLSLKRLVHRDSATGEISSCEELQATVASAVEQTKEVLVQLGLVGG